MISVTQLRQGVAFLHNGQPHRVLKYSHTHMGRGGGTIKIKVKNLKTGATTNRSFKSGEKVDDIEVAKVQMQFLYSDRDTVTLMDPRTYEQFTVPLTVIGDKAGYMQAGVSHMGANVGKGRE